MVALGYTALNKEGRLLKGIIEASTAPDAVQMLSRQGLTVMTMQKSGVTTSLPIISRIKTALPARGSNQDLEPLLADWAHLTGVGLTISQSVRVSVTSHPTKRGRHLAANVESGLKSGLSLEAALSQSVSLSPELAAAIAAGERSGCLPDILARIAGRLRADGVFAREVRAALIYPTFVLVTAGGVLLMMLTVVVPSIADVVTSSGAVLPWNTAVVFAVSHFIRDDGDSLLATAAALLVGLFAALRARVTRRLISRALDATPFLGGILISRDVARFVRVLATQVRGGVLIVPAVATSRSGLTRPGLKDGSVDLRTMVASGTRLSEAVATCLPSAAALAAFIRIGEENGDLAGLLDHAAAHYELQVSQAMRSLSTMVGPAMTLITGALVGAVVLSVMTALVGLNDLAMR